MYKILRVRNADPVTALIELEDAVNSFVLSKQWFVCGGHQLLCLSDGSNRRPDFLATQTITNSLTDIYT